MILSRKRFLQLAASASLMLPLLSACSNGTNGSASSERPSTTNRGSSSGTTNSGGVSGDSMPDGSTGALLLSKAKLPELFSVALPIPTVLKPTRSDATTDYFEIIQQVAQAEILPGLKTEIWGYNGTFPGPTIATRRGRTAVVRHRNTLPVPTVTHLHGGVTPPDFDGYPLDLVLPVGGWHGAHDMTNGRMSQDQKEYQFPLDQPAATLWYHDHRMDFSGPQVYRGLAGFHLHHDDTEDALPLPKGERDIPLMICDRSFAADGAFSYPSLDPTLRDKPGVTDDFSAGVLGDVNLVNGAPWPLLEVTNTRYRFRLLNAANARNYRLVLDPPPQKGPSFTQIGSDVGLLGQPVELERIEISQAERFDVIIDFSVYPVGTQVTLVNAFIKDKGPLSNVMRFHVVREANDDSSVPSKLVAFEQLRREDATVTREFHFAQDNTRSWKINGKSFDPARIDAQPKLNATELWRITSSQDHPFHMHLAHFQVLGRGRDILGTGGAGNTVGPYDSGWKDTVYVPSSEQVALLVRFNGFPGKYVFHCHNLEHEDMMMMANLEVV